MLAEYIREHNIDTPIIALTVVLDESVEKRLKELDIIKVISKGSLLPSKLITEIKKYFRGYLK